MNVTYSEYFHASIRSAGNDCALVNRCWPPCNLPAMYQSHLYDGRNPNSSTWERLKASHLRGSLHNMRSRSMCFGLSLS